MNKETLRMQMLAGVITEGQYKAKLEEVDSMGKIGNSYPAPGNTKVTLTSERRKDFEDAIFKRFKELKNEDGPEGAVYDIPYATRDILANILIGRNPNEYWDGEDEWEEALTDKGIDLDEFENYASALETEISRGNTNNPKIQKIQSWVKVSLDESMIGGIVGIGAINQIPATPKTDYEMAFEHFLGERYQIKPNRERDDIKDVNEEEEEMEGSSPEKRQMLLDKIHSLIPGREKEFLEFMGNSANSFEDYSGYSMDKLLDLFIDFEESENGEELTPEIADEVLDIYIPGFESGEGVF
jgi:hypothetical protein